MVVRLERPVYRLHRDWCRVCRCPLVAKQSDGDDEEDDEEAEEEEVDPHHPRPSEGSAPDLELHCVLLVIDRDVQTELK